MPPAKKVSQATAVEASQPPQEFLWTAVWWGVLSYVAYVVLQAAYTIRLGAINEYGRVIHEFDPYFNFRATEVSCWLCSWQGTL